MGGRSVAQLHCRLLRVSVSRSVCRSVSHLGRFVVAFSFGCPAFLPVSCPGYSAQATEHPASCLPVCLLDRLLCPGYCTPCHLPACLFAGQATLPRLLHTLPTACLPVCWPGYSAQQTLPPDCLPACVLARLFCPGYSAQATAHPATCLPACLLARLLCPGYCTPCHLPVRLPRLLCPGY